VVVEAKFHGLVLEAKLSGAPSPDDLEKLARGCNQLLAFKTALLEEYEELRDYQNADGVELVLVTYDDIPSPNFAVAKALTDLGVRDIDQITICSIYDLERLLSHVELPLFHALNEKRCNQEYGQAELGDWLSAKVAHGKPHPLLESAWRRIHTSWNLPGSSELANSGLQQSV